MFHNGEAMTIDRTTERTFILHNHPLESLRIFYYITGKFKIGTTTVNYFWFDFNWWKENVENVLPT